MVTSRAQLGEAAFAETWTQGRAMTLEQAMAEAEQTALSRQATSIRSALSYPAGLSRREVEVLRLLGRGLSNAQIAEELVVSLLTVKAHLRSIYSKVGVTSRSAATRYALEHHLS